MRSSNNSLSKSMAIVLNNHMIGPHYCVHSQSINKNISLQFILIIIIITRLSDHIAHERSKFLALCLYLQTSLVTWVHLPECLFRQIKTNIRTEQRRGQC